MNTLVNGIIPPMVTPLEDDDHLDEKGLENLINHLISGGVHGIFLLGTTGEAVSLTYELRETLIERACSIIAKRVPVMVGITDTSVKGSLRIAQAAEQSGADVLVISSPYYLPITHNEFIEYLEYLVPLLPLPFMLYNMPGCTKHNMSLDVVRKAKELGAIGIKDSSGNLAGLYAMIEEFKDSPDFSVISGTELFIPETITFAGHGAIAGGANLFPGLFVNLYDATKANDLVRISRLREMVIQIEKKIYNVGTSSSKYIKSIKCALSVMNICNDHVALPFRKFGPEERKIIEQNLSEIHSMFAEIESGLISVPQIKHG